MIVGWLELLDDVNLVDLLLHPADVAYTVPTLMHTVKRAGLNLLRCVHKPATHLPTSTFVLTSVGQHLAMVDCQNAHVFDIATRCSSRSTPDHSSCHNHQLTCSNQQYLKPVVVGFTNLLFIHQRHMSKIRSYLHSCSCWDRSSNGPLQRR